jgi:hypothetical protein
VSGALSHHLGAVCGRRETMSGGNGSFWERRCRTRILGQSAALGCDLGATGRPKMGRRKQTPILVRQDGERFVLAEGLHRLEACRQLGETTILG